MSDFPPRFELLQLKDRFWPASAIIAAGEQLLSLQGA